MSELKERFSLADEIDTRDLWGEVYRRATAPESPPRAVDWPPGIGRRIAVGGVAFAVFATAVVFAWDLSHPDPSPMPPRPEVDIPVDLAAELPVGWSELPAPPEVRNRAAVAWTGSRLFVWGGYVFDGGGDKPPSDEGFIFDAGSRSWEPMPAAPLSTRSHPAAAWTGEEFLIWGGFTGDCCVQSEMFLDDGAAFDPATGRWRALPASPLTARAPFSVWTGRELIVWGSRDRTLRYMDGAAYDPRTNTWRSITDAPIELSDGSAVWTGEEMVVFGAALNNNNHAQTDTDIGAAYDSTTDRWRRIPDSTLSPQAATAAWPGSDEMIAWDYEHATAAYDPRSDTWRDLPRVPLQFAECYPHSVAIPGYVFGDFCGRSVIFSAAEDRWTESTRDEIRGWVTEPAAAGSAFLVMAHPLELSEKPGVTFDTKMFAYVPPGADGFGQETDATPFVPMHTESVGETIIPLVWPDGTSATFVVPSELDLLRNADVKPSVSYLLTANPSPRFSISLLHGPRGVESAYLSGSEPLRVVHDATGQEVELWAARRLPHVPARAERLVFRTRSWTILVPVADALTAEEVADSLSVEERSGYPVIITRGPIALSDEFGEGEGPQLDIFRPGDPFTYLQLAPAQCHGVHEIGSVFGATCLAEGRAYIDVEGRTGLVRDLIEGARLEEFERM
jgi:N-acetylneuraminic acid mutarotase